jgi:hypothetical protein
MKIGRVGDFMISARASAQGSRWAGIFRITRPESDWTVTLPFQEEEHLEHTFETPEAAIEAAYRHAETLLRSRDKATKRQTP